MTIGEEFYVWSPNLFQSINHETGRYFGNVIGNVSLEDQLAMVDDEGVRQKANIQNLGQEQSIAIDFLAEKYTRLWRIADNVEETITGDRPTRIGDASDFIEAFLASYVPPVQEDPAVVEPDMPVHEDDEPVSSGAEFYIWRPNYFKVKNPETFRYFGTVIGNVPSQEQIWTVTNEGLRQREEIEALGSSEALEITELSEKYRHVSRTNKNVMKEIVAFFGGVFILDSSALDSAPLG